MVFCIQKEKLGGKEGKKKRIYPHEMPIQTSVLSLHVLLFEMFGVYAGHEHMQDIVVLLFKYIKLLQQSGVCKWIFEELSAVCETKFHYQDKIPPSDYVVNIASNMQYYPPKDWLVGSSLPSQFLYPLDSQLCVGIVLP